MAQGLLYVFLGTMQKIFFANHAPESPFFDLIADAKEVKIREVTPDSRRRRAKPVSGGTQADSDDEMRSFLVHLNPKDFLPGSEPPSEMPGDKGYLTKSAELLLENHDLLLARNLFSYILRTNPGDQRVIQGLGACYLKLGEKSSARKCFQALLEMEKSDVAYLYLAQCHAAEGNTSAALAALKLIREPNNLTPEHRLVYYKDLGNGYQRLGQLDSAAGAYQSALQTSPNNDGILVNLGTLELQRNQFAEATTHFERAVQINPRNARAHTGIGLVAELQSQPSAAMKAFENALNLDSQYQPALLRLVQLSQVKEDLERARNCIQAFLDKDSKNTEVHFALAVVYYKQANWWQCEVEIERILGIQPGHQKARALKEELVGNRYRV